jgi:tetratricopeptide (TPR) repeat protein
MWIAMTEPRLALAPLEALERVVYQARELGNLLGARQLLEQVREAALAEGDDELAFHLRALSPWIGARLAERDDRGAVGGERIGLLLVDVVGSGDGLLGCLRRCGGLPADARLPPRCATLAAEALRKAERAALRWVAARWKLEPSRLAADRGFRFEGPPAVHWAVDGGSIGLAAGVSVVAEQLGLSLPSGCFATGALSDEGQVIPVGGVPAKLEAVLREAPRAERVLLPKGQLPSELRGRAGEITLIEVASLDEAVGALFGDHARAVAPVAGINIEALVRRGVELYEKANRFELARCLLEAALDAIEARRESLGDPSLHRADELSARWRRASALVHAGEVELALDAFAEAGALAEQLWEAEALEPTTYLGLRGSWAVALRDAFRWDEAEGLLESTIATQRQLRVGQRDLGRTLGNLGELRTLIGKHAEARADLEASRAALEVAYPEELPRALCYLGNLERAAGDLDAARARFDEGLALNTRVQTAAAANEAFLRYGRARARLEAGDAAGALEDCAAALEGPLGAALYPGRRLLIVAGLARLALGEREAGREDLRHAGDDLGEASSLIAFGCALGHAELARDLLAEDPRRHQRTMRELVGLVAESAAAVVGLPAELVDALRDATRRQPGAEMLEALLRRAIASFPY